MKTIITRENLEKVLGGKVYVERRGYTERCGESFEIDVEEEGVGCVHEDLTEGWGCIKCLGEKDKPTLPEEIIPWMVCGKYNPTNVEKVLMELCNQLLRYLKARE